MLLEPASVVFARVRFRAQSYTKLRVIPRDVHRNTMRNIVRGLVVLAVREEVVPHVNRQIVQIHRGVQGRK